MLASKKGYYFLIDAVIGILVMTLAFSYLFLKPVTAPPKSRIIIISNDMLQYLTTTKIESLDDSYAGVNGVLWNASEITKKENTLMQQIGEFYHKKKYDTAEKFIEVISKKTLPSNANLQISVNNEVLYSTDKKMQASKDKSSITIIAKSIVFGVDENRRWGPFSAEVIMWE